jgi:hypothetical protein
MATKTTRCFKVKVPTTNGLGDTFNIDGKYYGCDPHGVIYVAADDIAGAARQIPIALSIEDVGAFATLEPRDGSLIVPSGTITLASPHPDHPLSS